MQVTIQTAETTFQEQAAAQSGGTQELRRAVEELGLQLEPLHPGIDDPVLASYYRVNVPDASAAERVIEAIRDLPSVAAAYVKPPESPP